eukprot:10246407-Heterocapsa_arctica.AAC.1
MDGANRHRSASCQETPPTVGDTKPSEENRPRLLLLESLSGNLWELPRVHATRRALALGKL